MRFVSTSGEADHKKSLTGAVMHLPRLRSRGAVVEGSLSRFGNCPDAASSHAADIAGDTATLVHACSLNSQRLRLGQLDGPPRCDGRAGVSGLV